MSIEINGISRRVGSAERQIASVRSWVDGGQVAAVDGQTVVVAGFAPKLRVGQSVGIQGSLAGTSPMIGEVIRVAGDKAWILPHGSPSGLSVGTTVEANEEHGLFVSDYWLGRAVSPLGVPIDGKGPLPQGLRRQALRSAAPAAGKRQRLGGPIGLGVRALDAFTTIREGQRLGLFAASGVGKSTLLAMLARSTAFDVTVLGLVGERGRELREFIEDDLGAEGLARSVVVCATSDAPPLTRRDAALASMAVAEHFRDAGKRVLLLIDSVTRFALACREIGLATGEPPATRGFPPSVFSEMPMLLERAGPGTEGLGSITALITVLVEGDDHDEPIADCVRGILDGHVVLDRRLAERGHYPPIDVLRSVSRTVPGCLTESQALLMRRARQLMALHADMSDLIRLGGYRLGTDPDIDEAIRLVPRIEASLRQNRDETSSISKAFGALETALNDQDG